MMKFKERWIFYVIFNVFRHYLYRGIFPWLQADALLSLSVATYNCYIASVWPIMQISFIFIISDSLYLRKQAIPFSGGIACFHLRGKSGNPP